MRELFKKFIFEFRRESDFYYRNLLVQNYHLGTFYLEVSMEEMSLYSEKLTEHYLSNPFFYLSMFEEWAAELVDDILGSQRSDKVEESRSGITIAPKDLEGFRFQIILRDDSAPTEFRELGSKYVSKAVKLSGIIVNISKPRPRAKSLKCVCRKCGHSLTSYADSTGRLVIPTMCQNRARDSNKECGQNPYDVHFDESKFMDVQFAKFQESPETIPPGEIPRSISVELERYLTSKVVPGTRVVVYGIYTTRGEGFDQEKRSSAPYIKAVGIETGLDEIGRTKTAFDPREEEEFKAFAAGVVSEKDGVRASVYDRLSQSIAPAIYGHDDIKRALAVQLFGGTEKVLTDGIQLRGSINVLLLGDPSTSKSQFLKFIEGVSPIGVYTSGKGSSAAGLTASVIKDPRSGEFTLESGAFLLASNGVLCIDEFDKMDEQDRVAIHEPMEQQTISIAKAGIKSVLQAKTSVLAAANPIFGRYDDMKSPSENIDFQMSILSRFDIIFVLKDVAEKENDERIARHILFLHRNSEVPNQTFKSLDPGFLKRYVNYAKKTVRPVLSKEAAEVLKNEYVKIRTSVRQDEDESVAPMGQQTNSAIPITVRQLEAIIRLSEGLAKMELSAVASKDHVNEAIRLLKVSTIQAATMHGLNPEGALNRDFRKAVDAIEEIIKKRFPVGSSISQSNLMESLTRSGYQEHQVNFTLQMMIRREELEFIFQKKILFRRK